MDLDVTATMKKFPTTNGVKYRPDDASNLRVIVLAATISIALTFLSIAFGVGIDPEMAQFMSP